MDAAGLIERIKLERGDNPAFNEDVNTFTGAPNRNTPYADYSAYAGLRKEIRRLGETGPDLVGIAIDEHLGVVRENGTLRPESTRIK